MGWMLDQNENFVLEAMQKSLVIDLIDHNRDSAEQVVPWFLKQMPKDYFQQLKKEVWYDHLLALNALFEMKESPDLMLRSSDDNYISFIKPHNYAGLITEMLSELPIDRTPTHARVFTSLDCVLAVNVFGYGEEETPTDEEIDDHFLPGILNHIKEKPDEGPSEEWKSEFTPEKLKAYIQGCPRSYLKLTTPQRFIMQYTQYLSVMGQERVSVKVTRNYKWHSRKDSDKRYALVSIATHNHTTRVTLENFANYMSTANLDIEFLYLDRVQDPKMGHVDMVSILLHDHEGMTEERWETIHKELERCKFVESSVFRAMRRSQVIGLNLSMEQAEIMTALCHCIHGNLNNTGLGVGIQTIIQHCYGDYITVGHDIASLFQGRFDPVNTMSETDQAAKANEINQVIQTIVSDEVRTIFSKMLAIVCKARRTNLHVPNRTGLSISLDPVDMRTPKHTAGDPYGVFFCHGRRCNMFHVRFREHSRGGMRVATPNGRDAYALRSSNLYEECYGLASTQQAKNKDIPEGGSKAVVLVRMNEQQFGKFRQLASSAPDESTRADAERLLEKQKQRLIFRSIRSCTNSLLDLISHETELDKHSVVYGDKREYVYLGPDEQITPDHINWVTQRAIERKLPYANAFMSSKPTTGINHKEFGVTTEGVCIYLDVALRNLGKDPRKDPITLKMTGGPSGDVAGNAIKILNRDYGENVRMVGIVDHTGCAEDPEGLDYKELLRLVENDLPISEYNPECFKGQGKLWGRDDEEGRLMSDSMHNRLKADAFLPGGGLPNTIRMDNWEQFLDEKGEPTSKLIVEAANIFIQQEAREKLTEKGVAIVKDSSANKCGVICSSKEIAACLLLSTEEILGGFRTGYVDDVIAELRTLARMEAELLFAEYSTKGGEYDGNWANSLPGIAERVSRVMNLAADQITEQVSDVLSEDEIYEFAARQLLPSLRERAGDRLRERVPVGFAKSMVATELSSMLVYREGLDYVERNIPRNKFAAVALQYAKEAEAVDAMVAQLENSGFENASTAAALLKAAGTRAALAKSDVMSIG